MNNPVLKPTIKPLVIKIGGAILEKESALTALLAVIANLKDKHVVLVHGGGCVVDEMLAQANFTTEKNQVNEGQQEDTKQERMMP